MRDIGERSEKSRNEGWAIISRGVEAGYFVRTASHAVWVRYSVENFFRGFLAYIFRIVSILFHVNRWSIHIIMWERNIIAHIFEFSILIVFFSYIKYVFINTLCSIWILWNIYNILNIFKLVFFFLLLLVKLLLYFNKQANNSWSENFLNWIIQMLPCYIIRATHE